MCRLTRAEEQYATHTRHKWAIAALADICMSWLLDEVASKTTIPFKIFRFVDDLFFTF